MEDTLLDQLCGLARLELAADERGDFKAKFERLLGFVEQVQTYGGAGIPARQDPQAGMPAPPSESLAMHDELELRRDVPQPFEWPAGFVHNYRVPQVIAFSEDEG
jgi:Asp-tRNA(Asn)/Glu-tRNA(Gln) amidotransferase C subunit